MHPLELAVMRWSLPALALVRSAGRGREARALARLEARNKVRVTALVADPRMARETGRVDDPLPRQVARCYALGDDPALWAVEGLGLRYAERALARADGDELRGLLDDPLLRPASLPMLHAGVGLAFARAGLRGLNPRRRADVERAASRFLERCRVSGREGHVGAAIESLGLVARFFHGPRMVAALATALPSARERGWLWHGAGRALYFAPRNSLPGRRGEMWSFGQCVREAAGDPDAARNLLAGNLWAITLVNARHPPVLAAILAAHHARLVGEDAATCGIASALTVRRWTTPQWPGLRALLEHPGGGPWDELFRPAANRSLETPKLGARVDELFRC